MIETPSVLPVSKLYLEHSFKKKKVKKLKKKCCKKYTKKKGRYCGSCPILFAMCENAGRDF